MKTFLVLILLLGLFSCEGDYGVHRVSSINNTVTHFTIVTIDGCEYIQSHNGYGNILAHKGDCKNPIHKPVVVHDTIYAVNINGKIFFEKLNKK